MSNKVAFCIEQFFLMVVINLITKVTQLKENIY